MDLVVELADEKDVSLEIGRFEDLETLVEVLDEAWEKLAFRLEKVPHADNLFVFVEEPLDQDEYECGVIEKVGKSAYALSHAVHDMIMNAYERYVDEFGPLDEEA